MKNILEYLEHTAENHPDKIGFTDEQRDVTFSELMQNAQRIAGSLARIGCRKPVAALTAVAAVWSSCRNEKLTSEANVTVTALAGAYIYLNLISKHKNTPSCQNSRMPRCLCRFN